MQSGKYLKVGSLRSEPAVDQKAKNRTPTGGLQRRCGSFGSGFSGSYKKASASAGQLFLLLMPCLAEAGLHIFIVFSLLTYPGFRNR